MPQPTRSVRSGDGPRQQRGKEGRLFRRHLGTETGAVGELELVLDLDVLALEEDDAALGDEAREVAQLLVGVGRGEDRAQLR